MRSRGDTDDRFSSLAPDASRYGAVEAGGTKIVCGIGDHSGKLLETTTLRTRHPDQTVREIRAYFQAHPVARIGIAAFGPVELNPTAGTYGTLLNTPKIAWRGFNWFHNLQDLLGVPVSIETDVNAALLAEHAWGAAMDVHNALYVTVGTGIGGGVMIQEQPVHGLLHPEMGHVTVRRLAQDTFPGLCPHHHDCLEGLASGPALGARWHQAPEQLPRHHLAWDWEAYYLAQSLATYLYVLSPERIILGGGVMQQTTLLPLIRQRVWQMLNGYLARPQLQPDKIDTYLVPPALGSQTGLYGGLWLAMHAPAPPRN